MKEKIDHILRAGFNLKSSDIHLTVGLPPMIRLNGKLRKFGEETLKPIDTEGMARAIIDPSRWEQFKQVGEIDFAYSIKGLSRFRINAFHQRSCVSIAIRILSTSVPSIDSLQLPRMFASLAKQPQGLILVTGPTGSGKSTTLAAMLDELNRTTAKHVITLEDPIEYLHKHNQCIIDQREIGLDSPSFSQALRASLRQDPDVILVGEMRDLETISTAITAAETGHLVLATLHTGNAPKTIDRIIDVFPSTQQTQIRVQLASVLTAIISQRLFPLKNGDGRVAAFEIMLNNVAIRNLIRNEKIHQIHSTMQTSKASGMKTMQMSVKQLLEKHMITEQEASPYLIEGGY